MMRRIAPLSEFQPKFSVDITSPYKLTLCEFN
jgi:hypothetical protein